MLLAAGFFTSTQAAYYYQRTVGITGYNRDAAGKDVLLHADSNKTVSRWFALPFNFNYFGNAVTGYHATANGYITFDNITSAVTANTAIPNAAGPNNAIYALWDNIRIQKNASGTPDAVYCYTTGSAGSQIHTIQWFSATDGAGTGYVYATIRLHESGKIEIIHDWAVTTGTSATVGIENADGSVAMMVGNSPNYNYPAVAGDYTKAVVYTFQEGTQLSLDMSVDKLNLLSLYGLNNTLECKGSVTNLGSTAVTSFTVGYSVNGGTVETSTFNSLNLKGSGDGMYDFTHSKIWTPTTTGNKTIKAWIVDINGSMDENHANDTITFNFVVVDKTAPRVVLHEVFSSSTCGPCRPGNVQLMNVLDQKDPADYAMVKYQMSWPGTGDPYYTLEGNSRRTFYAVSGIPDLNVDGAKWKLNPTGYTTAMFDEAKAIPAIVEIAANHWRVGNTVWATATFTSFKDLSNVRAFMVINEKITDQNVKTNGEAEFHHVMKKMMTGTTGQLISSLKANTPVTISKDFTFPGDYTLPDNAQDTRIANVNKTFHTVEQFDDLEVVVFLQNTTTKEVYQAANSKSFGTGVANATKSQSAVKVFPNPAQDNIGVDFNVTNEGRVRFEIVNQLGQVVKMEEKGKLAVGEYFMNFSTETLNNGVYYLNVVTNGNISTQTFIVAH